MVSTPRGEVLWQPDPAVAAGTAMGRFAAARGLGTYAELHAWSVTDLEGFWAAVADEVGIRWRATPEAVLAERDMPGARWFPGGRLNHAEHALAAAAERPDAVAVVSRSQTRPPVELTWAELAQQVARCAAGLARLGVGVGDRVVAYAPNIAETLVAALATASLGAIWSSCAPEFGIRAVVDRFAQIGPTVLVAVDGYRYGDKAIDRRAEVAAIEGGLPTLRHTVRIPYLRAGEDHAGDGGAGDGDGRGVAWADLLAGPDPGPPSFAAVPFDHPLWVLYSSGTTGLPKPIVHGHGGVTLEQLKYLRLHQDLGPDDRFSWFTTTGWVMWNILVSGLLTGATVVLFDGDPLADGPGTLWQEALETGTTVFGASAGFLMACRKAGLRPDRGQLRWVGSTGAPLPAEGARWVLDAVGVPVGSMSGGTDVCGAFVGAAPLVPVRAGEISCALLGCAVEAFDPQGRPCPPGVTGELVLTRPMPSMPVSFWGDPDGGRYRAAYFDVYPGVWRHGDWITFTEDGSCVISGRSDATLNRGGVRLGTSDLYTVVEDLPEVADSLVVHLEDDAGGVGELLLFVSLAPGNELDEDLRRRIAGALRTQLSPRHVPDQVAAVPVVPRTLSGKKLEVPVKRVLQGTPVAEAASLDSLADPTSLVAFESFASARRAGASAGG